MGAIESGGLESALGQFVEKGSRGLAPLRVRAEPAVDILLAQKFTSPPYPPQRRSREWNRFDETSSPKEMD